MRLKIIQSGKDGLVELKSKTFQGKENTIKTRALLWILLIPAILAVMAAPLWIAALFALLWILAASLEFLTLYIKPFKFFHAIFLLGPALIWAYTLLVIPFSFPSFLFVALILQVFLWLLIFPNKHNLLLPIMIVPIYLGFIPAHLVLLKQEAIAASYSYVWLIFPFIVIWIHDTSAYFFGMMFGRTPLIPKISPKKTVEGFVLGAIASTGAGIVLSVLFLPNQKWWLAGIMAFLVTVAGVMGDLLESALKRERGVKNSSEILGGHGGFLDRIDSLIFGVAVYYYLHFFLKSL